MQFFQALMEAAKKSIVFKVKKTLNLNWKQRLELLEPLSKKIDEFVGKGILVLEPQFASPTDRQVGFRKSAVHSNNSISQFPEFNCVICNQKLDPLYLNFLRLYYEYKITCSDCEDSDKEGDASYEMVLDGCIVKVPSKRTLPAQLKEIAPKSPHVNIWAGRNMWQVKEKLTQLFFKQMNRLFF